MTNKAVSQPSSREAISQDRPEVSEELLDGTPTAAQDRFWALLPAPVRAMNGLLWKRRYRKRNLWDF